ncbi:MAG TPA: hypothetical protein VI007_09830 [bacterium]
MKRIAAAWAMGTPATIALAFIVAFAPPSPAAGAPPIGTISGIVENHTGGTRPAPGIALKLTALVNGAEQESKDAAADARGRFRFAVPVDPQRSYVVKLTYKGGEYETPAITLKPGQSVRQVHMRVYEPTSDPSVLKVNVHHIIVEPGDGAVQVAELLVFTNKTDRTYIGGEPRADGKRETLRFALPAGAANVQYMEGLMECCVTANNAGLVDTMDVEPGMRSIAYSYTLPVARASLALTRRLDYPAERLEVFGNVTAQLAVSPLARQDDVKTEQGVYARFSGASLGAGTDVALALSGLPVPRSSQRRAAIAAFTGLITAGLVFPFLRRGRRPAGPRRPTLTREELVAAIAALDDRFEAGEIPEVEYRSRRAQLMNEIDE